MLLLCLYPLTHVMETQAKYFCCPVADKCAPKAKCAPKVECIPACGKKETCKAGYENKNKFWIIK